jgi:hypothetical protein
VQIRNEAAFLPTRLPKANLVFLCDHYIAPRSKLGLVLHSTRCVMIEEPRMEFAYRASLLSPPITERMPRAAFPQPVNDILCRASSHAQLSGSSRASRGGERKAPMYVRFWKDSRL